jgi:ketosteroid isomerase-like protein
VTGPEPAREYVAAFVRRDYDRVHSLLTDDFRLRDLSRGRVHAVDGADAAVAGLRAVLDGFASVRLGEIEAYDVADVTYLRARVHFTHAEAGERFLEQHHLLRIRDGRIVGIDEALHRPARAGLSCGHAHSLRAAVDGLCVESTQSRPAGRARRPDVAGQRDFGHGSPGAAGACVDSTQSSSRGGSERAGPSRAGAV